MGQLLWRADDDLVARVRAAARRSGRSANAYISVVLDAATDPALAGDEATALRERLARAGLLVEPTPRRRRRPNEAAVAAARAVAGAGTPLSDYVSRGR